MNQTNSLLISQEESFNQSPRKPRPARAERRPVFEDPLRHDGMDARYLFRRYLSVRNAMALLACVVLAFLLCSACFNFLSLSRAAPANAVLMVSGMVLSLLVCLLYLLSCLAWQRFRHALHMANRRLFFPHESLARQGLLALLLLVHPSYWLLGRTSSAVMESYFRPDNRYDFYNAQLNVYGYLVQFGVYVSLVGYVLAENLDFSDAQSVRVSRQAGARHSAPLALLAQARHSPLAVWLALLLLAALNVCFAFLVNFSEGGYLWAINRADYFSDAEFAAEFAARSALPTPFNTFWAVLTTSTRLAFGDLPVRGTVSRVLIVLLLFLSLLLVPLLLVALGRLLAPPPEEALAIALSGRLADRRRQTDSRVRMVTSVIRARVARRKGFAAEQANQVAEARRWAREAARLRRPDLLESAQGRQFLLLNQVKAVAFRVASLRSSLEPQ